MKGWQYSFIIKYRKVDKEMGDAIEYMKDFLTNNQKSVMLPVVKTEGRLI